MYFEDHLHGSGQEASVLGSSQHKSRLPPEQTMQEEDSVAKMEVEVPYNPHLGGDTFHHFSYLLMATQANPVHCG